MEHSPTSATGTRWERTPWHATQRANFIYVLLSLLARANRETDVVDVLRGDHGPGVHGREPERLPERLHVDGEHRAARGRRGPGPAQIRSGLHGIDRVEQLGEVQRRDRRGVGQEVRRGRVGEDY